MFSFLISVRTLNMRAALLIFSAYNTVLWTAGTLLYRRSPQVIILYNQKFMSIEQQGALPFIGYGHFWSSFTIISLKIWEAKTLKLVKGFSVFYYSILDTYQAISRHFMHCSFLLRAGMAHPGLGEMSGLLSTLCSGSSINSAWSPCSGQEVS